MGSETEAWWALNYSRYSIKDLSRLPLFSELQDRTESWDQSEDQFIIHGLVSSEGKTVAKTYASEQKKEALEYDTQTETWTYRVSETKSGYEIVSTAHIKKEVEWGSIVKKSDARALEETWRLDFPDKSYSKITTEADVRKCIRAGTTQVKGTSARWVEETWEEPEEKVFKKAWERPSESGGESRFSKGNYTWGENWYSSGTRFESKIWHRQQTHEWGKETGHDTNLTWRHEWDLDSQKKTEDRLRLESGRTSGYKYRQEGVDWHKEEWEGRKFEDGEPQVDLNALESIYIREYRSAGRAQEVLDQLLIGRPQFADSVAVLKRKIGSIHNQARLTPASVLQSLTDLQEVKATQEQLELDLLKMANPVPKPVSYGRLFELLPSSDLDSIVPMPNQQLASFFAEFLDAKYIDDNERFDRSLSPATAGEFLPIYLMRITASEEEAQQRLGEVLLGLKIWKETEDPDAVFLSELLAVNGAEPIPYIVALFLLRARKEFQHLSTPRNTAKVLDLVSLLHGLFKNDNERGQELILALKPESIDTEDYFSVLISARFASFNLSPAQFFSDLGSGKVKEPVLVGSLKQKLDLWMNDEEISQVFTSCEEKGFISQEAFESRLGFETFRERLRPVEVSEAEFLRALAHSYRTKAGKDSQHLALAFAEQKSHSISPIRFESILRNLDSSLTPQQIQTLISAALQLSGGFSISKEAFVETLLEYPIGPYSKSVFGKS